MPLMMRTHSTRPTSGETSPPSGRPPARRDGASGRGDVWWCELPEIGRRPVVVLSRDAAIPRLRRLLIGPCSAATACASSARRSRSPSTATTDEASRVSRFARRPERPRDRRIPARARIRRWPEPGRTRTARPSSLSLRRPGSDCTRRRARAPDRPRSFARRIGEVVERERALFGPPVAGVEHDLGRNLTNRSRSRHGAPGVAPP